LVFIHAESGTTQINGDRRRNGRRIVQFKNDRAVANIHTVILRTDDYRAFTVYPLPWRCKPLPVVSVACVMDILHVIRREAYMSLHACNGFAAGIFQR
jgi:hypothetical protein